MSRYPPLTIKELQAIQEANKGNPDVRRLLWEVHRLHQVLSDFDIHLAGMGSDLSYLAQDVRSRCMVMLDREPSIRRKRILEKKVRRKDKGIMNHYKYASSEFNGTESP